MGNSLVRYKAELDFDGRELTRSYLDKHDLNAMLEVNQNLIVILFSIITLENIYYGLVHLVSAFSI